MSIQKRVPPSPEASALYDELYELYLRAGEPAVRTLADACGPGVISHNTTHKVINHPDLTRLQHLKVIVKQLSIRAHQETSDHLDSDVQRDVQHFTDMWMAAKRAKRPTGTTPRDHPTDPAHTAAPQLGRTEPDSERDQLRQELDDTVHELDKVRQELDDTVRERDELRQELDDTTRENDELLQELTNVAQQRDQLLEELHTAREPNQPGQQANNESRWHWPKFAVGRSFNE